MVPVCGGLERRFHFEISVLQQSLAEPGARLGGVVVAGDA